MNFLKNVFETVSSKTGKGPWYAKSFWWLILVGVGFLFFVSWALHSFFTNRKLASALHERDSAKEDLHQEKLDRKLDDLDETRNMSLEDANLLEKSAAESEKEVDTLTEEVKVHQEVIESLESWDDVKKRVKF